MTIIHFPTSGEAYDACQRDETINDGDVLVITSEGVVGIADTWPVAVTVNHTSKTTLAECLAKPEAHIGIEAAKAEALRMKNLQVVL
jgi:hypothetical protein